MMLLMVRDRVVAESTEEDINLFWGQKRACGSLYNLNTKECRANTKYRFAILQQLQNKYI